jgi:hypothetical protein
MDGACYVANLGLLNDSSQRILSRHTQDEMLQTRRAERLIEFHQFWGVDGVRDKRWISCKLQAIGVNKLSAQPGRLGMMYLIWAIGEISVANNLESTATPQYHGIF